MIFTIGHSTRTADEFLVLLDAYRVDTLADVRTIPRSRRHPHFSADALATFLPEHRIRYVHVPGLGGLRKPRPDSVNGAWLESGFRGYADYMQTSEFVAALDTLIVLGTQNQVAVMCAEAKWWQCHRQLVADALVARHIEVRHILSLQEAPRHELTAFARVVGNRLQYPSLL